MDAPFEWWEYDTAGLLVLPAVSGPPIPHIPTTEAESCERAGYERLAENVAATEKPNRYGIA